jgi:hypothetical protein
MVDFGVMINLQPDILNWIVNGENEGLASRKVVSTKTAGGDYLKITYEGDYREFLKNYLKPKSLTATLYPDRDEINKFLSKGKLLSSLIEYKRRWNINKDSAKVKIDNINFKGNKLIIKTTEFIVGVLVQSSFNPLVGATGVSITPNIAIGFPEDIKLNNLGTYSVQIIRYSDDVVINTYTIDEEGGNTDTNISVVDDGLFIDHAGTSLALSTEYYVLISANSVESLDEEKLWGGITDKDTWKFTTTAV